MVLPYAKVSGSTCVACCASVSVYGSVLTCVRVMPPEEPTVRENVAVCVAEAPVPVIVTVEVPVGVLEVVAIVRVEEAPAVTVDGLKLAVAPVGKPEAVSATDCALPEVTAVET